MKDEFCAICDIKLSEKDNFHKSSYDFIVTCSEHKQYGQCFQPEIIKKNLGLISELSPNKKKCGICEKQLSEEEQNCVMTTDFQITCNQHKEVKSVLQHHAAKAWFKFKEINPSASFSNENDWAEFNRWFHTNNSNQK